MSFAIAKAPAEWRPVRSNGHISPSTDPISEASRGKHSEDLAFARGKSDVFPSTPGSSKSINMVDSASITRSVFLDPPFEPRFGLSRVMEPLLTTTPTPQSPKMPDGRAADNNALDSIDDSRSRLKNAMPRVMQISAPTPNGYTDFLDFATTTPRTPPVPPKNRITGPSVTEIPTQYRFDSSPVNSTPGDSRLSNSGSSSWTALSSSTTSNTEPPRKVLKFQVLAKAVAKLRGNYRSSTAERPPPPPAFPPLLYSFTVPIEEHVLAISARVKEEFKLKLTKNYDLPRKDAEDEVEIVEELHDVNREIGDCARSAAKLIAKAKGLASKSRKSDGMSQIMERDMRTTLNQFMVTRIFQPFSIELDPEADEILRERYQEIVPKVPQFIAARWRVLASSSTSRPIQQLTTALYLLAVEAASLFLGEFASDEKLSQELDTLLLPVIRHAYLLAHFIHLEMLAFDYDIFCGTELGGWLAPGQEERQVRSKVPQTENSRVNGYWSLGLRKKRFVGQGTTQRQVWDVVLKAKVITENALTE